MTWRQRYTAYEQRYKARLVYTCLAFAPISWVSGYSNTDEEFLSRSESALLATVFAVLLIAPLVNVVVAAFPGRVPLGRPWKVLLVTAAALTVALALAIPLGWLSDNRTTTANSCDQQTEDATVSFARSAGRIGLENGSEVLPSSEGCHVFLLVPHSAGADPMDAIDKSVGPDGWQRKGNASWVRADGIAVSARRAGPDDPMVAEYEIDLLGSPPD